MEDESDDGWRNRRWMLMLDGKHSCDQMRPDKKCTAKEGNEIFPLQMLPFISSPQGASENEMQNTFTGESSLQTGESIFIC